MALTTKRPLSCFRVQTDAARTCNEGPCSSLKIILQCFIQTFQSPNRYGGGESGLLMPATMQTPHGSPPVKQRPAVRRFYLLRGCAPAVQQTARPPDAMADSLLGEPQKSISAGGSLLRRGGQTSVAVLTHDGLILHEICPEKGQLS